MTDTTNGFNAHLALARIDKLKRESELNAQEIDGLQLDIIEAEKTRVLEIEFLLHVTGSTQNGALFGKSSLFVRFANELSDITRLEHVSQARTIDNMDLIENALKSEANGQSGEVTADVIAHLHEKDINAGKANECEAVIIDGLQQTNCTGKASVYRYIDGAKVGICRNCDFDLNKQRKRGKGRL